MTSWTADDEGSEQRHVLLVVLGLALLLVAALVFYLGTTRGQWPTARAQVLAVQVRCEMDAQGYSRGTRRAPPVFIACDQVDRFRADNPHRRWSVYRRYSGDVRVVRDGSAVTIEMGLGSAGNPPRIGDTFDVVQNPDVPTDVALPQQSLSETLVGACLGGLGTFVLAVAFFWF
jgi:hypothetical protein